MANRLKPIPVNQSEVTQGVINTPYLANEGKPISQTVFDHNRGTDYSSKGDTVQNIAVSLEDIDNAIMYYFTNVIKPNVIQNGQQLAVPVIYGSPERWKSVQADGFYRDNSGRLMVPIIMFKRETVEKDRTKGNSLDGNTVHLYQTIKSRYNSRNAYDNFDILNNRIPSEKYYLTAVPDYLTLTYNCIIFTDFVEQNNKLVEAIEFASDAYWGDPARWKFRAMIDSFATTTILNEGEDRAAKTTFTIKVNGYIIPNTVNADMAAISNKFYTKSQIVFTMETVSTLKELNPKKSSIGGGSALEMKQDVESFQVENLIAPKTAMGGAVGVADAYNVNITNTYTGLSSVVGTYLNTNIELLCTQASTTTNTAIFPKGFLAAPTPLPATSINNFVFFVNGQLIEPAALISFVDNGNGTSTLTVNTAQLGFNFRVTDEIVGIGKFA